MSGYLPTYLRTWSATLHTPDERVTTLLGGRADAYPVSYEVRGHQFGAVLKLTDALGRTGEIAMEADDVRVLALCLLGALPAQSVSGVLGSGGESRPAVRVTAPRWLARILWTAGARQEGA